MRRRRLDEARYELQVGGPGGAGRLSFVPLPPRHSANVHLERSRDVSLRETGPLAQLSGEPGPLRVARSLCTGQDAEAGVVSSSHALLVDHTIANGNKICDNAVVIFLSAYERRVESMGETFGTITTITAGGGFVIPSGRDIGFPQRFEARVETDGAPLIVTMDVTVDSAGRPTCRSIRLDPAEGTTITAVTMRTVRLADLLRVAMGAAAERVVVEDGRPVGFAPMSASDVYRARGETKIRRRRRRASALDPDLVRRAAEHYRDGLDTPLKMVERELHVSRSTASRLVRAARDAGLLAETDTRKAKA